VIHMGQPSPFLKFSIAAAIVAGLPCNSAVASAREPIVRLSPETVFLESDEAAIPAPFLLRKVAVIDPPEGGAGSQKPAAAKEDTPAPAPSAPFELPSLNLSPAETASADYAPPQFPHSQGQQPGISFGRGPRATAGWQLLPEGLLYRTWIAGDKESRMQLLSLHDTVSNRQVMDSVLGGRVGLIRNGSVGGDDPQGFQIDLDGAVFARVLPDEPSTMLEGSDYRVGLTGTWREETTSWRTGYSHISSHIGDEFLLAFPTTQRLNYVRDSLLIGVSQDLTEDLRIYGEAAWAAGVSGGAEPLELQAGTEWTPTARSRWAGAPFVAVHGHYRQEQGSLVGVNTVAGWNWHGVRSGHRLKVGANYYHGPSLQYSFVDREENLIGGGIWLDF
jgi:hypothetical protein